MLKRGGLLIWAVSVYLRPWFLGLRLQNETIIIFTYSKDPGFFLNPFS